MLREVFHQVPVLPVVVPLGGVVFCVLLWRLHRRKQLTAAHAAVALVLCVYLGGVVANTLFPIYLDKPSGEGAWTEDLAVKPLTDYEAADAVMNMVVFAPLGVLIPLLSDRARWWYVVVVSAGLSAVIEVSQFLSAHLLGGGHIADVNDFLFNVVGATVGFAVLAAAMQVPTLDRFIDRFRWH